MCKKKHKPFKKILGDLRRNLSARLKGSSATCPDSDELAGDFADVAGSLQRKYEALATREFLTRQLKEVVAAFDRIEKGIYGICASCLGQINAERLKYLPTATHCTRCAPKIQKTQKLGKIVFTGTHLGSTQRRVIDPPTF